MTDTPCSWGQALHPQTRSASPAVPRGLMLTMCPRLEEHRSVSTGSYRAGWGCTHRIQDPAPVPTVSPGEGLREA